MTRATDPEFWDKVRAALDELPSPEPQVESYVGPEAGFCVLGAVYNMYKPKAVKLSRRRRLWNKIRFNPVRRRFSRLMHDRYCCGYCHGPY